MSEEKVMDLTEKVDFVPLVTADTLRDLVIMDWATKIVSEANYLLEAEKAASCDDFKFAVNKVYKMLKEMVGEVMFG